MKRNVLAALSLICLLACQPAPEMEKIVVIGGGLMGSSTGWELARSGAPVVLIEQQDSVYTYGSSFGEARISRSLGPQGDIFSFLQQNSVAETEKLIAYLNESGEGAPHSMEDIYRTSPVTYIRYRSQAAEIAALLDQQLDRYDYAPDPDRARELFGMDIPDSVRVIREYKRYSGTLNPKVLIGKLQQGIRQAGGSVRYNEKVIGLTRANDHYEIQLQHTGTEETRTIRSKKVVAAAGPYNGQLVQEIAPYFAELITPKRLFLAFLKIDPAVYDKLSADQRAQLERSYPVADISPEIYYSMIEEYDADGHPLLKVGGHFLRTDIADLDAVWQKQLSPEEIDWSKRNTARYLGMLGLPVALTDLDYVRGYSCVYSLTESEVPYVTPIIRPDGRTDPNFLLVGGMSGVGAKGSLTYGLLAADLLLGKDDPSPLYQQTKRALGVDRLAGDLRALEE